MPEDLEADYQTENASAPNRKRETKSETQPDTAKQATEPSDPYSVDDREVDRGVTGEEADGEKSTSDPYEPDDRES